MEGDDTSTKHIALFQNPLCAVVIYFVCTRVEICGNKTGGNPEAWHEAFINVIARSQLLQAQSIQIKAYSRRVYQDAFPRWSFARLSAIKWKPTDQIFYDTVGADNKKHWKTWSSVEMASFFAFSHPIDIDIKLFEEENRKEVEIKSDKDKKDTCPIYYDGEAVKGQVIVRLRDGKSIKHDGIKVEFVGCIGAFWSIYRRSSPNAIQNSSTTEAITMNFCHSCKSSSLQENWELRKHWISNLKM